MAVGSSNPDLAKDVQALFRVGVVANWSDGQLLARFAGGRAGDGLAESAYTELVRRHGPMVLRVCRKILGDPHDTQDAFQATFLVLARKADSVRRRDSVAGWLHGTALRVAQRARVDAARRRVVERRGAVTEAVDPVIDEDRHQGWPELHDELSRLPEKYRAPLVLCYLEGLTTEAAAHRLGCPQGTILCRLSRGRERLRSRLIRRGLKASVALVVLDRAPEAISAAMPAGMVASTVRAALQFAAGGSATTATGMVSGRGLALAKGVLKKMLMAKLKLVGVVILGCTTIATIAPISLLIHMQARAQQSPAPTARPATKEAKPDGRWVKKLPSGAVVELVGITQHLSGLKTWWSPNGETLSEAPGVSEEYRFKADPNSGEQDFAIRILGSSAKDDDVQINWKHAPAASYGYSGWVDFKDRAGRVVPGLRMFNGTFPAVLKSTAIRIGVATGPWKTEATCTPDGRSAQRGQSAVIFGLIKESNGEVDVSAAHKAEGDSYLLTRPEAWMRVHAVDHDGKAYETEGASWNIDSGIQVRWFHYPLRLKSIREFRCQTRPYEWAEFKDIPLLPPEAPRITP